MKQHGSAFTNPAYGLGVNSGNGTRFITYMSLLKENYGHITREMVQEWRKAHYTYDVNGVKHDTLAIPDYGTSPRTWRSARSARTRGPGSGRRAGRDPIPM